MYDLSLHGVCVSIEVEMEPGDVGGLTRRLPKQIALARITAAMVQWIRDQRYGLASRKISQASSSLLTKFMNLTIRRKD